MARIDIGEDNADYRKFFEERDSFAHLGKKGNFKLNEMVNIIFEQPNILYLITRKILKLFLYDHPKEELVHYYWD